MTDLDLKVSKFAPQFNSIFTNNVLHFKVQILIRFMNFSLFLAALFQLMACKNENPTTLTLKNPSDSIAQQYKPTANDTIDSLNAKIAVIPEKLSKAVVDSNSRVIYLTFDDGPLAPSPTLLKIVEEKQIKMTEFAVGKHALANKNFMEHLDNMKRSPYFEVQNHSYSHANSKYLKFYSNPEGAAEDIMGNETKLNLRDKIVRMPGRDIWATPNIRRGWSQSGGKTAKILLDNGYKVYGWDVEWEHYGSTLPKMSPTQFVAQINSMFDRRAMETPNHLVVLGHDEMLAKGKGKDDLREIIDMLKAKGYIFEFISNYPR